jgi:hypothetical protein
LKDKIKEDLSNVKVAKFLGYCKCGAIVSTLEQDGKIKYICTECKYKGLISGLKAESIRSRERPETKKEYLQSFYTANYHDMPGFREKSKESIEKSEHDEHNEVEDHDKENKDNDDVIDPVEASLNSAIIPPLVEKYGGKEGVHKKSNKRGRPRKKK